ncbi:MAG: hypothetical protein ACYC2P_12095 [Paludibacteraceae bacterium]
MKKVLAVLAVVLVFVACNKTGKTETTSQTDSLVIEQTVPAPADSLSGDSVAQVDSVAPAM